MTHFFSCLVASSILSWQASSNILVKTASTTTLLFGPYVAYQHRKLKNLNSLRQAQNNLRGQVNYLVNENERLQRNLSKLDSSVAQLERVERELTRIAGTSYNVKRLVEIVNETNEIQQRMEKSLKSKILSTILGVVCKSDANGDFNISEKELQVLIVRLSMMDGVYFREGNFRKQVASLNLGVSTIMSMIRTLLQENDETVFSLRPEELTKR
jgi:septal ring factor EnvC (AmiA/AmiB activator)